MNPSSQRQMPGIFRTAGEQCFWRLPIGEMGHEHLRVSVCLAWCIGSRLVSPGPRLCSLPTGTLSSAYSAWCLQLFPQPALTSRDCSHFASSPLLLLLHCQMLILCGFSNSPWFEEWIVKSAPPSAEARIER